MDKLSFVEGWTGIKIPQHIKDLGRAELVFRVHGIVCGEFRCPNCGQVYEEDDYPSACCVKCRTPLPEICVNKSCDNQSMPIKHVGHNGQTVWYPPMMDCAECQKFTGRAQRSAWMEKITPAHIHAHLGAAYYWGRDGRAKLDKELKSWFIDERCGEGSRQPFMYVVGPEASGKSVGVMYHVAKNHLGRRVKGCWYVSEPDLLKSHANKYSDSFEDKAEATAMFAKCADTELLILDDLGMRTDYRQPQIDMLARTLGDRMKRSQPTILIGRHAGRDNPLSWLSSGLSQAFKHSGRVVEVWRD